MTYFEFEMTKALNKLMLSDVLVEIKVKLENVVLMKTRHDSVLKNLRTERRASERRASEQPPSLA